MKKQIKITIEVPDSINADSTCREIESAIGNFTRTMCELVKGQAAIIKEATVLYAAGYQRGTHSYGMFAGPNPDLQSLLEYEPELDAGEDADAYIFKMIRNGDDEEATDRIYRWSKKLGKWIKCKD